MSGGDAAPLGDARVVAEALADALAERGMLIPASVPSARVLAAAEVALLLPRDRRWVHGHADELGAFRYDGCGGCSIYDLAAHLWNLSPRGSAFHEMRRRLSPPLRA
jgi:hypothetical protein